MHLGVVRFPSGSTDPQIKDALDRFAPLAIQKAMTRASLLRSFRADNPNYVAVTDEQLATSLLNSDPLKWSDVSEVAITNDVHIALLPVNPPTLFHLARGDHISHLYIASSSSESSIFYTRGQFIKALASAEAKAMLVLQDLAIFYDSPRARPAPFSLLRAGALVASGAVAVPWGLFFLLLWVSRYFSHGAISDSAMNKGHVCPRCHGKEIVRLGRGGDRISRLALELRRKRPYQCLDCDHRFLDHPVATLAGRDDSRTSARPR